MGKLILISGGNGSGKSRYAESLIAKTTGPRFYIATMQPQTQENCLRIQKHIAQRADLDFLTVEQPVRVSQTSIPEAGVVLLEDVSNLLGNTLFSAGGTEEMVWQDILALKEKCTLLVAVTIGGLSPEEYEGETAAYIAALNSLNRRLHALAEAAVKMTDGRPIWEKGREDAFI